MRREFILAVSLCSVAAVATALPSYSQDYALSFDGSDDFLRYGSTVQIDGGD